MPRGRKPYKKVGEVQFDEPARTSEPLPDKPQGNEERRLFQVTVSGIGPAGTKVVHGTKRAYLTKAEAQASGHHWSEKPFIGKVRKGIAAKRREESEEEDEP